MSSMSVGANPNKTFPNSHLTANHAARIGRPGEGGGYWSSPQPMPSEASALQQLMDAVAAEDWKKAFEENKTGSVQAEAKWSATADRCGILQCLCTMHKAMRVLEIGSFCGVATLAMAETLPKDGHVVALELEKHFVDFGAKYRMKSKAGGKIETKVGPAVESLKDLVAEVTDGERQPFDFVVIDGDKASMAEYLQYVRGEFFLSDRAVVCVDVTPFKGQLPTRFKKFGAEDSWRAKSGEEEIESIRKAVEALPGHVSHEFGGLLVIQRAPVAPANPIAEAMAVHRPSDVDDDDEDEE